MQKNVLSFENMFGRNLLSDIWLFIQKISKIPQQGLELGRIIVMFGFVAFLALDISGGTVL